MEKPIDVLVIGAGMAGIQCALRTQAAGLETVVVDKGSRAGGRMATRPLDGYLADHGAQYLEFSTKEGREHLRQWREQGWVRSWSYGFEGESGGGLPRYLVEGGMNQLPARLAEGLDCRFRWEASAVKRSDGGWVVESKEGDTLTARRVVISSPLPQTLRLLKAGGVAIPRETCTLLETVRYEPCFTLLVRLQKESGIPCPGGMVPKSDRIAWIADNQQKGISGDATVITLHATPGFSEQYLEEDPERVKAMLLEEAVTFLPLPAASVHLHRWRFARPKSALAAATLALAEEPTLLAAGDAFGSADV